MDQEIRNKLRNVVTQCRKLLEDSVSQELEGKYGIFAKKDQVTADPNAAMTHLTEEEQAARKDILDHFGHIKARGFKPKEALDQLVREIAFTHLNRLCAYKMMEAREVYAGGQKFREAVSRGINSNGVKFYLADHPEEERLFNTGHQDIAYRHFLDWLGGLLSDEIGVLFGPNDPANRLYPRQKTLDEVLDLLNGGGIKAEETGLRESWLKIWSQDETIGWVYQYFTPKELRDQARKESQAPRNSYELAFRNQFFTPRYVLEFLTDNTLGRIWYEMRKGETKLKDQCRRMIRRPTEIFLKEGGRPPKGAAEARDDFSQEELLTIPVHIPHRPKKDPRELKILDPACGSGHFLLYCFDLLLTIYEEAYSDLELGPALRKDYPRLEDLWRDVPRLILACNLHGIEIDQRASQIAALALWLRCQRAYQEMGLKKDRPRITRSNFVCAEPMPGEEQMLKEFIGQLEPKVLGQVVEVVFDKMKLAGEAGSLLKIEEEIRNAVATAKNQWARETTQATDKKGRPLLFTEAELDRIAEKPRQPSLFDLSDITDEQFFEHAEAKVIEALRSYSENALNGQRLQRRLFTDDAVRGFAFLDLCHKRYDVVLMNPPFGLPTESTFRYLGTVSKSTYVEMYASFVERWLATSDHGFVGAITSRSFLTMSKLSERRRSSLLERLTMMVDLGNGIMDDAMVRACAFVVNREKTHLPFVVLDLGDIPNKERLCVVETWNDKAFVANNRLHTVTSLDYA
jgi:Eco57I restriction-modification methylase